MTVSKRYTTKGLTRLALFALTLFYLTFSPILLFYKFQFFPEKVASYAIPDVIKEFKPETVTFKADNGCLLYGFYLPVRGARYTVLIHHGQGANIGYDGYAMTAQVFARAGANVLLYDYEGYGRSEGRPSSKALRRDALAAYNYLLKRGVTASSIVQCGISLGTGPAADLSVTRRCAGTVLVSPYLALSQVAQDHLPYLRLYPAFCYPQPDLGAKCLIGKRQPLLMVHSISDPILPIAQADRLARSYADYPQLLTYFRVPMGGHIGALSDNGGGANGCVQICRKFLNGLSTQSASLCHP